MRVRFRPRLEPDLPAPARMAAWLLLAMAVLLAHLLLLAALRSEAARPDVARPLQMRWLVDYAAPATGRTEPPPSAAPAVDPALTQAAAP